MSEIVSAKRMGQGAIHSFTRDLYARAQSCLRMPIGRFAHPWIGVVPEIKRAADSGDGFGVGDYSAGLFSHDASEAAIELLHHEDMRIAAAGSLLNLLDNADARGHVHRTELAQKARDIEPAKPLIAQFALRCTEALGADWANEHDVYARVSRFVEFMERDYTGPHGLILTPSSRASGFDNDPLSAGFAPATVEGPDTNSFMVLEYEALVKLAALLGKPPALRFAARAERLRELMEMLLYVEDERGGFYRALTWRHGSVGLEEETVAMADREGRMSPMESWVSLLPLYAGVPSKARAAQVVRRLVDPEMYWGPRGVRTVARLSPIFSQAPRALLYDHRRGHASAVSNWGGPVWILANYYLFEGLRRYGYASDAAELAHRSALLLAEDLARSGGMHECYDDAGTGLWPPGATFVSWNVLALTMLRNA